MMSSYSIINQNDDPSEKRVCRPIPWRNNPDGRYRAALQNEAGDRDPRKAL